MKRTTNQGRAHMNVKQTDASIQGLTENTLKSVNHAHKTRYCTKCGRHNDVNGVCEVCEPDKVRKVKLPNNYMILLSMQKFKFKYNKVVINDGVCTRYSILWFSLSVFRYIDEKTLRFGLPKKRDLEREARK